MSKLQTYFLEQSVVSMGTLERSQVPIREITYLTLGGGLGSFAWVDHLRVYGVPVEEIAAIGITSKPHGRYKRLCLNSQIPNQERLRSDSGSTPDNIWGWPGYAVREIGHEVSRLHLGKATQLTWQIFSETAISEAYTPRAGDVYRSVENESNRIGWDQIWRYGRIRAVRKTTDGRYAALYEQKNQASAIIVAPYLHIAMGYPGLRFLPDLQEYRRRTKDFKHVVNAYEEHEHLYNYLGQHGGVVMLRGRGIVASRILQRLYEVQEANPKAKIKVIHLMRSPQKENTTYKRSKRVTENHWQLQPYNFPKACFTGDLRHMFEQELPDERKELIKVWAGTTTADREDWRQIVDCGLKSGWYEIRFGDVEGVDRTDIGQLATTIKVRSSLSEKSQIVTDFIVDCTGLNGDITMNPVLRDLVAQYELPRNSMGNITVTSDFEMEAMRNGEGRAYASGAMTLGGPFGPVDSFLGLQYAAHRSVERLASHRTAHLQPLNTFRSLRQWTRWARKEQP